jgi:hypothetical protein
MLGLALSGTYTLIREGTIPAMKVGARWVVPKFDSMPGSTASRTRPTNIRPMMLRQFAAASVGGGPDGLRP